MKKVAAITDVQLLGIMVARFLREEHRVDEVPGMDDYTVQHFPERFNRSSDISISVKIGRGVSFDVTQHWPNDDCRDLNDIVEAATAIADNIAALDAMRGEIMEMCTEVRAAVRREIAKAKRLFIDYKLITAQPYSLWDSVRDGFAVNVVYERLSEYLRPEKAQFGADCAEEVAEAFEGAREEQERRSLARYNLDAVGATGRIDSVVVNAMRQAGYNIPHVLQLLATTDDWIVDFGERSGEPRFLNSDKSDIDQNAFRLHWKNGDVYAQIVLGDGASWHQGTLSLQKSPVAPTRANGKRLSDLMGNPIFGDIKVQSSSGKKGEYVSLRCERDLLHFDASTGRLWAA